MVVVRRLRPPEFQGISIEKTLETHVTRFGERKSDWETFEDVKIEGYKRAQHRCIGSGGPGKRKDPKVIPPRVHTLSTMCVEPGRRQMSPCPRG